LIVCLIAWPVGRLLARTLAPIRSSNQLDIRLCLALDQLLVCASVHELALVQNVDAINGLEGHLFVGRTSDPCWIQERSEERCKERNKASVRTASCEIKIRVMLCCFTNSNKRGRMISRFLNPSIWPMASSRITILLDVRTNTRANATLCAKPVVPELIDQYVIRRRQACSCTRRTSRHVGTTRRDLLIENRFDLHLGILVVFVVEQEGTGTTGTMSER